MHQKDSFIGLRYLIVATIRCVLKFSDCLDWSHLLESDRLPSVASMICLRYQIGCLVIRVLFRSGNHDVGSVIFPGLYPVPSTLDYCSFIALFVLSGTKYPNVFVVVVFYITMDIKMYMGQPWCRQWSYNDKWDILIVCASLCFVLVRYHSILSISVRAISTVAMAFIWLHWPDSRKATMNDTGKLIPRKNNPLIQMIEPY